MLISHLPSANCFDTLFQPELTFYAASKMHLYLSLSQSQHLFTYASFLCSVTCRMTILHPQLVVNSCSEYTTINVACSVKTDKCCFTPIYLKQAKDNKRGKIQSTDFGYSFFSSSNYSCSGKIFLLCDCGVTLRQLLSRQGFRKTKYGDIDMIGQFI